MLWVNNWWTQVDCFGLFRTMITFRSWKITNSHYSRPYPKRCKRVCNSSFFSINDDRHLVMNGRDHQLIPWLIHGSAQLVIKVWHFHSNGHPMLFFHFIDQSYWFYEWMDTFFQIIECFLIVTVSVSYQLPPYTSGEASSVDYFFKNYRITTLIHGSRWYGLH